MYHIHGTPFSGPRKCADEFFKDRYVLIPFKEPENMEAVKKHSKNFVIDNSAFTFWRQGGELDYDKYVAFVEKHQHPKLLWSIIPDIIGGSDQQNDEYIQRWPKHLKGVPVYHMHSDISRLKRLINQWEWVAIGSSGIYAQPGSDKWWDRMAQIMDAICDEHGNPPCKLHGLRMLNPEIFTQLPLASADSTNVVRNCNTIKHFGRYVPITAAKRAIVIAERIELYQSAPVWVRSNQIDLFKQDAA